MNWLEETIKQDVNDLHSDDIYKQEGEPIQFVDSSNYNPNTSNIGEYYENGEDGYEWVNHPDL